MSKKTTVQCKGPCRLRYTSDKLLDGLCIQCLHDSLNGEIEQLQAVVGDLQNDIEDQNADIKELRTMVDLKHCHTGFLIRHDDCVYRITTADPEEGINVRAGIRKGHPQSLVVYPKTEKVIRLVLRDV